MKESGMIKDEISCTGAKCDPNEASRIGRMLYFQKDQYTIDRVGKVVADIIFVLLLLFLAAVYLGPLLL